MFDEQQKIDAVSGPESSFLKVESVLAVLVAVGVLAATYIRLYFGVNFADEAFYIAMPQRFVLGDTPFRDEVSTFVSLFSLVSYPFFKLYHALFATTEGIVLYARHLFFAFQLCVAAGVYRIIRNFTGFAEALLIASCVVAFVPFNISGVSYNTLSVGFLTLGLFAGAWGAVADRTGYMVASGVLLALCSAVYLPMMAVVFVAALFMAHIQRRSLFYLGIGASSVLVVLAVFLWQMDWGSVRDSMTYVFSAGMQNAGLKKLLRVIGDSITHIWPGLLICGIVCTVVARTRSSAARISVVFLPIVLLLTNRYPSGWYGTASHGIMVALALIAPWIYREIPVGDRRFFGAVWVPSVVASLVVGFSSSNGYLNSGIALLAAGMVSLAMLMIVLRGEKTPGSFSGVGVRLLFLSVTAGVLVYYQFASVYWESGIGRLTAAITSGPYKYLRTTPRKAMFVDQVGTDVRSLADHAQSVVFYYDFPAGYLFSNLKPATNAVWLFSPRVFPRLNTALLDRYYSDSKKRPDIIVRLNYIIWADDTYLKISHSQSHPIDRLLLTNDYQQVIARSEYTVYLRKPRV